MNIVDCLGQILKTGDVVMPTNDSTFHSKPQVITRMGTTDRVQLNAGSYAQAGLLIKINEQLAVCNPVLLKQLTEQYKPLIQDKPVEKKKATPKYIVVGMSNYSTGTHPNRTKDTNVLFAVVEVIADTNQERMKQYRLFIDTLAKKDQRHCLRPEYERFDKVYGSSFTRDIELIGIKKIRELGLEQYINGTIPTDTTVYVEMLELYLKKAY